MTRVSDFTNETGYKTLSIQSKWSSRSQYGVNKYWTDWSYPDMGFTKRALHFKSITTKGGYLSAYGFRQPTPYSRCIARLDDVVGDLKWYTNGGRLYEYTGVSGVNPDGITFGPNMYCNFATGRVLIPPFLEDRAIAEARLKFLDKKVDLGVAFAEWGQSVLYLADRVAILARALLWFRRNWRSHYSTPFYKNPVTAMADAWLAYQYAIKPLIYDIWGASQLLDKGVKKRDTLFKVTRTVSTDVPLSSFLSSDGSPCYNATGKATCSAKVQLWGVLQNDILGFAAEVGLLNPLLIAWELFPYSFVIDWLMPIGNWLESLTAVIGVEFVGGCTTLMTTATITAEAPNPGYGSFVEGRRPTVKLSMKAMERKTHATFPFPLPYLRMPSGSDSQVASALALLLQLR